METLLSMNHVTRRFHDRTVIEAVNLEVRRGEVVSLMGPNGAGKSTLLRLALGLDNPDEGEVWRAPDLVTGYMPQRVMVDPLFPLCVERFIRLRPGVSNVEARRAAERTGISAFLSSPMASLSGGETQRALLARAIVRHPDLLVLDEPVQGVDLSGQVELYRLIATLRDELECGVLMVSHDLHLVMAATDRVVCLNRHVCCSGAPRSVAEDPAYRALFGDGSAQFALYAHQHNHRHGPDGEILPEHGPHADHDHHHGIPRA